MKRDFSLFVLLAMLGVGAYFLLNHVPIAPPQPTTPAKPIPTAKIQLYFFTMKGCGPCALLKEAMKDEAVQKELSARFSVRMVDAGDRLAKQYKVSGFPTLIALSPTAVEVKHEGAMTSQELLGWLQGIK